MNLSELIDLHRGARSYADLERDCGGAPSKGRLQQLVRQPIKNFPDPPTVRALAKGLRVPQAAVVLAAAESLGLDVRRPQARLIDLLPGGVELLSELQAAAIAHLVSTIIDPGDEGGDYAELEPKGPEPDLGQTQAARMRGARQWIDRWGSAAAALQAALDASEHAGLIQELERLVAEEDAPVELPEAARLGTPRLRSVKHEQDQVGEEPDPEGPEGGA